MDIDLVLLDLGLSLLARLLLRLDLESLDGLSHLADFILAVEPAPQVAECLGRQFQASGHGCNPRIWLWTARAGRRS